jgi:hypothetical protein
MIESRTAEVDGLSVSYREAGEADTGHFAVEDHLEEIAEAIVRFHAERIAPTRAMRSTAVA